MSRETLEQQMGAKRPRVLTDDELEVLRRVTDTRVKPITIDDALGVGPHYLSGFAAEYYSSPWNQAERELMGQYWTPRCDEIVRDAVQAFGYHAATFLWDSWMHAPTQRELGRGLAGLWGAEKFAQFRRRAEEPEVKHVWYNIIISYAMARAERLDVSFQHYLRCCAYCSEEFNDVTIGPVISKCGYRTDFCEPCLRLAFQDWKPRLKVKPSFPTDRDYLAQTLLVLCKAMDRAVSMYYIRDAQAVTRTDMPEKNAIIAALVPMQPAAVYAGVFDDWAQALAAAGCTDRWPPPTRTEGTASRRSDSDGRAVTARPRPAEGERCIARDGHKCDSQAEAGIDNWLSSHGIPHERNPQYPRAHNEPRAYRADWRVGDTLIEYWGLEGDARYEFTMRRKRRIAREAGIRLIEIRPEDDLDSALRELLDGLP